MSTQPGGTAFDVSVGDHRFRRTENGVVGHYIGRSPDHSANGLTTTLELFAQEIVRLRALVESRGQAEGRANR